MAEAEAEATATTWAEVLQMESRLRLLREMIADTGTKDDEIICSSGLSKEAREARLTETEEQRLLLTRECMRILSDMSESDPDFSGMSEADRAAEAARLRRDALEEARVLKEAGDPDGLRREGEARALDFDPKQGGIYFNRCTAVDLTTFDHDEESPYGPMRFTDAVYQKKQKISLCGGINILSVKIACSDVGYPMKVYGTVVARDSIDDRCVYLYRRDRDHSQLLRSKDESLILTGPKRGLALLGDNFVEIDLKIKEHQGQDRELSKGFVRIRGITVRSLEKCKLESKSLETRLSTVDVNYAVVKGAVEATIAVEVLEGDFVGKITAHTTNIKRSLVLYNSRMAGAMTGDGHGVIQLKRPVVAVSVTDRLMIVVKSEDDKSAVRITFTPRIRGRDDDIINVGATKMRVKVAWSIMDPVHC